MTARWIVVLSLVSACASPGTPARSASPSPTGALPPVTGQPSQVVAKVRTGGTPCGIVEAFGSVWVTDAQNATLLRINPRTHAIIGRTPLAGTPCELTTGFGSLWVATQSGVLQRVDPRSAKVLATIAVGRASYEPLVAFGSVWVSNRNSSTVSRINPHTNAVTATVPTPGLLPGGLVEAGGAIWVGNDSGGATALAKLDPTSLHLTSVMAGSRPSFVTAAAGSVWVASEDDGSVTQLDPRTGARRGLPLLAGVRPVNLAAWRDREVWVPDDQGNLLTRIDASSGAVLERLLVGSGPAVAAPVGDSVWVSMFGGGEVWQVRPGAH